MTLFGPLWSRALCVGCASIEVKPEWSLAVLALESGFDPLAKNASGARGLWQKMPTQVVVKGVPLVLPVGAAAPLGCVLRDVHSDPADRKRLTGHTVWRLYAATDPVEQIRDAFAFWRSMRAAFRVGTFKSREALYCLNLAPARLAGGTYTDETVLYPAPGAAYLQNAKAFGLNPLDPHGVLRMKHLAHGLDAAVKRCQARYDAELTAAYVANVRGETPGT